MGNPFQCSTIGETDRYCVGNMRLSINYVTQKSDLFDPSLPYVDKVSQNRLDAIKKL